MRHRKAGIKLNRSSSHRNAMFRNMVTSLFKHDRIQTTDAKAKELRRWADHLITLAKRGDLHARRQAMRVIREKAIVHKLFEQAPGRFGTISGGYTRTVKLGHRPGDAASMTIVELVSPQDSKDKKKRKKKKEPVQTPSAAPTRKPDETPSTQPKSPEAEAPAAPASAAEETTEAAAAHGVEDDAAASPSHEGEPKTSGGAADTKESPE